MFPLSWRTRANRVLLLALALLLASAPAGAQSLSPYGNPVITLVIRGVPITAEVVSTPEKLYLGLSHRPALPPGHGMLFLLPTTEMQHFCMRDMRFGLDFLWLKDGQVVGVTPEVPADFPGTLTSPVPVSQVLEVPAGFAAAHGIQVGDPVEFRP